MSNELSYELVTVDFVSLKSVTTKFGKRVRVGIKVNDKWYNRLTEPYSVLSSLKRGQQYKLALIEREKVAKKPFKMGDQTIKKGETYLDRTMYIDNKSIDIVSKEKQDK